MTIHLDNNEAHLLQTMLKVELMRVTSVLYAKEIKPLADCFEGLLDKLQPKQKNGNPHQASQPRSCSEHRRADAETGGVYDRPYNFGRQLIAVGRDLDLLHVFDLSAGPSGSRA